MTIETQVEPVEGLAEDGVLDAKAAALVAATEHGVPAHVLECLTTGGSLIPPNAIDSMVRAVLSSRITQQAEEIRDLNKRLAVANAFRMDVEEEVARLREAGDYLSELLTRSIQGKPIRDMAEAQGSWEAVKRSALNAHSGEQK